MSEADALLEIADWLRLITWTLVAMMVLLWAVNLNLECIADDVHGVGVRVNWLGLSLRLQRKYPDQPDQPERPERPERPEQSTQTSAGSGAKETVGEN